MSSEKLQNLTEQERSLLEQILEDQCYPCSAKALRRAMQRQGSCHPEYLITRSLRELLSEGKTSYKGGRWTLASKEAFAPDQQPGHSPHRIQEPLLSEEGRNTIGRPRQVVADPAPPPADERSSWSRFRRLLRYYIDCVRSEEGAEVLSYLSNMGSTPIPRTLELSSYSLLQAAQGGASSSGYGIVRCSRTHPFAPPRESGNAADGLDLA